MARNQIRQYVLAAITLIVMAVLATSLAASLREPQITDRLQLYQTDLVLQATELQGQDATGEDWTAARDQLLGQKPLETALKDYQTVRESAVESLDKLEQRLQQIKPTQPTPATAAAEPPEPIAQIQLSIQQQQALLNQLDLRIGILQAVQEQESSALQTWSDLIERPKALGSDQSVEKTAQVLTGLWSTPPQLLPDADVVVQQQLDGWFRDRALTRLYELQQRPEAIAALQQAAQETAKSTLVKLALVGTLPTIGSLIGIVLLGIFGWRWWRQRSGANPETENLAWSVPWDWTTVLQVLVLGFFLMGQIVIPLVLQLVGFNFVALGERSKAGYTLLYYLMMSGAALLVLYLSVRSYKPLPDGWFRATGKRNWVLWGVGGYLVALPLMLIVSVVNQQIWQGQGGSNPLLEIVLEEGDPIALGMFFFTAAVAAPVFEEIMFRGFLLPSLTRYFPVWQAIGLSALIFALAHLSLSEVLPLAVLGSVLGLVYVRSRGLLASMLLHSLWNSVTMVGLFILGSG